MDLESITKAVNKIVANIPVTVQINKLTSSHLSVVFSRQKDCTIEYTDLYEKVLETLKSFEMGEIKSIKFFGRESDGDYEWQYDFIVNTNSQNVLPSSSTKTSKDEKVNKALVIGAVVVLISTGVGGFLYFNNFQYQQAKQAAKQAISQDFVKCENAKLNTENNIADTSESPEIQKLRNQSIAIAKKANDAKIKNTQDSINVLEDYRSLILKYESQKSQVRAMKATGKIDESNEIGLLGRLEEKAMLADIDKINKINNLKKELLDVEYSESKQIDNINRQIAERQLIEKTKADELKKQKMEDDKKSCQIVDDYKRKYER